MTPTTLAALLWAASAGGPFVDGFLHTAAAVAIVWALFRRHVERAGGAEWGA